MIISWKGVHLTVRWSIVKTLIYTQVHQDPYAWCAIAFYHSKMLTGITSYTMILMINTWIICIQLMSTAISSSQDMHPYISLLTNLPYLRIYDTLLFMNESILKIVWKIMNTAAIGLVKSLSEKKKNEILQRLQHTQQKQN